MLHTMGGGLKNQNKTTNKTPTNWKNPSQTQPKPPHHYQTFSHRMKYLSLWRSAYQVLRKRECSEGGQMSTDAGCWVPLGQLGKIVASEARCNWPHASASLTLLLLSCQIPWPAHLQGSAWESRVFSEIMLQILKDSSLRCQRFPSNCP